MKGKILMWLYFGGTLLLVAVALYLQYFPIK